MDDNNLKNETDINGESENLVDQENPGSPKTTDSIHLELNDIPSPVQDAEVPSLEFPPSAEKYEQEVNQVMKNQVASDDSFAEVPEYLPPKEYQQNQGYTYTPQMGQNSGEPPTNQYQGNVPPYNPRYQQRPPYGGPPQGGPPYAPGPGGLPPHMQGYPPYQQSRSLAVTSLILAIASIVLLPFLYFLTIILAIVAIVLSSRSKKREGPSSLATAGMIVGIVGLSLNAVLLLFAIGAALMTYLIYDSFMFS